MAPGGELKVFSGGAHPDLARSICEHLGIGLGEATVGRFPDGEIEVKVNEDVRGRDVFLVQPTCPPVNENLMELLVLADCLRRASAERITAVIPYFGYARKDRKDEGRVPITAKLVANLITHSGVERVLAVDLHAAQIQGFFDIPVDHLYAKPVLVAPLHRLGLRDPVVVSPDVGGIKVARAYSKELGANLAIVDKRRVSPEEAEVEAVIGEVRGRPALLVDDMITTGGTIAEAVRILKNFGAASVFVAATHGVFCGKARERLDASPIERIFVTDTIPSRADRPVPARTEVVSIAPLLARAISRIHRAESLSLLFEQVIV
ncbi:MAG TPA: ribose-phosphate pyrophosphokinase [Planctomycetota bacterium]|jgi:ribose-phosphate pyrophosphokinase|nr:ribose-phosphate pyrophosphokinase [Planctomycetota bacterium]